MKHTTPIAILALSAALTLASCDVNRHTPEPEDQKVPLSFSALSQNSAVKSGGSFPHSDFGVWGIARKPDASAPYILWEESSMVRVEQSTPEVYVPISDAFWLPAYTYSFIALAPYTGGVDGLIDPSIDAVSDSFSYTFDMGPKYSSDPETAFDPDFDLMGAVARTYVEKASTQEPQKLSFRHLFAQINIKVSFVDADGNLLPSAGTVSRIHLDKVNTKADYTLGFGQGDALSINSVNPAEPESVTFHDTASATLHVVPQNITGVELYLDFVRDGAAFQNFKAVLSWGDKTYYNYNERYNWNINIGPKNAITFKVEVTPWVDQPVNDEDIEII